MRKKQVKDSGAEVTIARMKKRLKGEIDAEIITDARGADERAAELVGESGLDPDSDEYSEALAILCDIAGKSFPGEW